VSYSVGLKCFFSILPKCLFVIIIMYAYFIDISQGSVETQLRCGGIYNNHVIANCLQSVSVNEFFENRSIIGEDVDKSKVPHLFLAHPVDATELVELVFRFSSVEFCHFEHVLRQQQLR